MYKSFLKPLFFSKRFYWVFAALIGLFILSYSSTVLFFIARILTFVFFLLVLIDYLVLFSRNGINANRILPERLSNGDENPIKILIHNKYSFRSRIRLIDELPVQFQQRDFSLYNELSGEKKKR